jgi:hypothetical protein
MPKSRLTILLGACLTANPGLDGLPPFSCRSASVEPPWALNLFGSDATLAYGQHRFGKHISAYRHKFSDER